MTASLRQILRRIAPALYNGAAKAWGRYMDRRYRIVQAKVIKELGLTVNAGPFAGMDYIPEAFYGPLDSKIIGSYEAELHEVLGQIISREYSALVDIGCAEGYYAVGLARAFPGKMMYAFDAEPEARELCRKLARLNNVQDRIIVSGACGVEELNALPLQNAFLICDCEGCEMELMNPELVPAFKHCDLLIELHDFLDPRISPTILARFEKTHEMIVIASAKRDPKLYPSIQFLPSSQRALAVSDRRWKPDQWVYMTVKNKH